MHIELQPHWQPGLEQTSFYVDIVDLGQDLAGFEKGLVSGECHLRKFQIEREGAAFVDHESRGKAPIRADVDGQFTKPGQLAERQENFFSLAPNGESIAENVAVEVDRHQQQLGFGRRQNEIVAGRIGKGGRHGKNEKKERRHGDRERRRRVARTIGSPGAHFRLSSARLNNCPAGVS